MKEIDQITNNESSRTGYKSYVAVRPDFVLKRDGDRAILYPLLPLSVMVFYLTPQQGIALALLDGKTSIEQLESNWEYLFGKEAAGFKTILDQVDALVSKSELEELKTAFVQSDTPLNNVRTQSPEDFVVDSELYKKQMADVHRRKRLSLPISILAVFTYKCTANCIYCYAHRPILKEMSLQQWDRIIQDMTRSGIKRIAIDNGDVLARKDGIDWLEMLIAADILFVLSTKTLLTKEHIRRLKAAGFAKSCQNAVERHIQLSIDSLDPATLKYITGRSDYSESAKITFSNLIEADIVPKVKSVVMPCNSKQLYDVVDYFAQHGAQRFEFTRYMRSFHRHKDECFLDADSQKAAAEQLDAARQVYPDMEITDDLYDHSLYQPDTDLQENDAHQQWQRRPVCAGGWSTLNIASDGNVFLCEQMPMSDEFVVGDLKKQTIAEVWNSDRLKNFIFPPKTNFTKTPCFNCNSFETCRWENGICYRDAYFSYGTIHQAPPSCPRQNKKGLKLT